MASSKGDTKAGDAKPKKVMDVAQPGKSAPSATSRPIIITNRPMLKRDPMVAAPGDKADGKPSAPVSRVAKSIKITSFDQPASPSAESTPDDATTQAGPDMAASEPAEPIMPLSGKSTLKIIKPKIVDDDEPSSKPAKAKDEPKVSDEAKAKEEETPDEPVTTEKTPEQPVHHADKEVALEVGIEALAGAEQNEPAGAVTPNIAVTSDLDMEEHEAPKDTAPAPSPDVADETTPKVPEPTTGESDVKEDAPASEAPAEPEPAVAAEDTEAPKADEPAPAEAPAADVPAPETSDLQPDEVTPEVSDGIAETDEQLAPNVAIEQAKHKQEEAEAAIAAERERIIASKQYYLPIKSSKHRHGTRLAIALLLLVIVLAAVWVDVVLDAGIVRIPGVQAPTNFFH